MGGCEGVFGGGVRGLGGVFGVGVGVGGVGSLWGDWEGVGGC